MHSVSSGADGILLDAELAERAWPNPFRRDAVGSVLGLHTYGIRRTVSMHM